ncbi:alpha/beta hydrolase [Rhizobium leguminosarum]|uniref:alpha/beta hydrolase n=1 Tax=Rhizobium leguminosarum TaxID=384 RepID=UPI00103FB4CB|nr:alpha/beta hydrolase [Rhizobium leguminosarum]TBY27444.1 alpha/beta hydrolase [Rhizobium leguminosarum bv. viciae]
MNSKLANFAMAAVVSASALALSAAASLAEEAKNVVLVHGAFAGPGSWDKVAEILKKKGLHVTIVKNPLTWLEADVKATKEALAKQDGPTVLVGHSWGGVVLGESGDEKNVSALVYVAAFAPDKGESLAELAKGGPQTEGVASLKPDSTGGLVVDPKKFDKVFAGDLPKAEADKLNREQIPTAPSIFEVKASVAAWHDKPTFYAVSEKDMMIPLQAEEFFAGRMKADTIKLQSSHVAMVSHPKEVADLILRVAAGK